MKKYQVNGRDASFCMKPEIRKQRGKNLVTPIQDHAQERPPHLPSIQFHPRRKQSLVYTETDAHQSDPPLMTDNSQLAHLATLPALISCSRGHLLILRQLLIQCVVEQTCADEKYYSSPDWWFSFLIGIPRPTLNSQLASCNDISDLSFFNQEIAIPSELQCNSVFYNRILYAQDLTGTIMEQQILKTCSLSSRSLTFTRKTNSQK